MLSFEGEGGQGGGEDDDDTTEHLVDGGVGVDQAQIHQGCSYHVTDSGDGKQQVIPAPDLGKSAWVLAVYGGVAPPLPFLHPQLDVVDNEAGGSARKGEEGLVERLLKVNAGGVGRLGDRAQLADIGSIFTVKRPLILVFHQQGVEGTVRQKVAKGRQRWRRRGGRKGG